MDRPHFAHPFQRDASGKVAVVEQDTAEHVDACEHRIIACPTGFRDDLPEFGWDFPEFANIPIDPQVLTSALRRWEPRGKASAVEYMDAAQAAVRAISVDVEV